MAPRWPVLRQLTGPDRQGLHSAAKSAQTDALRPRTVTADKVVKSICPYCAVGCGQNVYVADDRVVQIEGDPDSPISRGRLCPKGSATLQLTTGSAREKHVLYRRPHARDWEQLDLDTAMEMVADRVLATRRETWEWEADGKRTRRTLGIASLGGATLDNEENYLIKKLFTALGIVQVENQARVCHSSTVAALGTSFGRGGSTTYLQDLQRADCIVIEGSNFAEAHPVGFQWVMEAKSRGATIIHVDPHFSRTSAMADIFVPLRAGTDIAWLGGLINYVISNDKFFREYVVAYTNAATIITEDFADTEDLDGLFSGYDPESRVYDSQTWQYEGGEVAAASGERDQQYDEVSGGGASVAESGHSHSHGSGGPALRGSWRRDETLQDPRCVFQILKRHYSRYTPEMVEQVCGVPQALFRAVAEAITANSGRDRTTAFAYAVGWTQHTVGVQYIRAASVLQLLLGNIGRPGGGIMALRGHASIQGSSDIPTLFDLLPGYIPMPHAHQHEDLQSFIEADSADRGFWANMDSYFVSLLKAWWAGRPRRTTTSASTTCRASPAATARTRPCRRSSTGCARATSCSVRTPPSGRPTPVCNGGGWPSSTGWSYATSRSSRARRGGRTAPRYRPARCAPRTSAPRCSSSPPHRTRRRAAASPTPTGWCSGTTRRSNRTATGAATCGSCCISATSSGASWPARRTRPTGPCWTSPGTTSPRATPPNRLPRRCSPRSTAGTPTASCSRPTPT